MSDSLWPHGLYTTRLLCPWNSPGKNTGVCSHSLFQEVFLTQGLNLHYGQILYHWATSVLIAQSCLTLCDPMDCSPPGSSVHGDSAGKNTGVGSHSLLQGIFQIQGSNSGLLHCRQILQTVWATREARESTLSRLFEWLPDLIANNADTFQAFYLYSLV